MYGNRSCSLTSRRDILSLASVDSAAAPGPLPSAAADTEEEAAMATAKVTRRGLTAKEDKDHLKQDCQENISLQD